MAPEHDPSERAQCRQRQHRELRRVDVFMAKVERLPRAERLRGGVRIDEVLWLQMFGSGVVEATHGFFASVAG
jgi:hypothetical protein